MANTKTAPTKKRRPSSAASGTKTSTRARAGARSSSSTTKGKASTKSTTTKKASKSSGTSAKERTPSTREFDPFGFVKGGDSSIIAHALVEGGFDRKDVNDKIVAEIEKTNGIETRGGGTKNVPSLVSGILSRLEEKGYTVESEWRLVPPADVATQMKKEASAAKRRASRTAK